MNNDNYEKKHKIILFNISLIAVINQKKDMGFFQKLFGKEKTPKKFTQEEYEAYDTLKMKGLEYVLGKSHDKVGHAIIPFQIGGTVDMYYFLNSIKGTGFATMELINPDSTGPIPNETGTYELVAFTKHSYTEDDNEKLPFNQIERRICGIFTSIGSYSYQTKLNSHDTGEIPQEDEESKTCLIFDEYKPDGKEFKIGEHKHGLLLIIEVFQKEMDFAVSYGTNKLIEKLKAKGYYPYSDLDRELAVD